MDQAGRLRQHLAVGQLDAALAAGRDGEDAGLERAPAHVFQQRRITLAPDDVLVDGAGLVAAQQLALQLLAIHPHVEARDRGVLRQREDVGALDRIARLVDEDLVDLRRCDLVDDRHIDAVILDRQRDVAPGNGLIRRRMGDDDAVGGGD